MMTLAQKKKRFILLNGQFIIRAYALGYELIGGELQRTLEQHTLNLAKGTSKAKLSFHLDSLAQDYSAFKNGVYLRKTADYEELGLLWESLDPECVWGGRFGDNPATSEIEGWDGGHFQYGGKESLQYYKAKGA
jgi:hypothetical protein